MPIAEITFGQLSLCRDTILRLDAQQDVNELKPAGGDPSKVRTQACNCPQTTRTKVTAHCC
jgi:hypothetical protein